MKRIEFTASNGRLINFKVDEIVVVLARYGPKETEIYITGINDGFVLGESYKEVMRKIEGAENADI